MLYRGMFYCSICLQALKIWNMECICIFKNQGSGAFNNRPIICYVSFFDRKYVEHLFTGNLMPLQALLRSRCFLGCVCMCMCKIVYVYVYVYVPTLGNSKHTRAGMLRSFLSLSLSSPSVAGNILPVFADKWSIEILS
jgi:hypothetical protein